MGKMEKNMEEILDVAQNFENSSEELLPPEKNTALIKIDREHKSIHTDNNFKRLEEDFQYSRENLKSLIESGFSTLETLTSVAAESESPRAFEVLGKLVETLVDANQKLLNLQETTKKIEQETISKNENTPDIQNNVLFIGSTADLQKLLNGRSEQVNENNITFVNKPENGDT